MTARASGITAISFDARRTMASSSMPVVTRHLRPLPWRVAVRYIDKYQ